MALPTFEIGFIGCGKIAQDHADVLSSLGHHISSASARPGSLHLPEFVGRNKVPRAYSSHAEQMATERPDAWWVVTPYQVTHDLLPALAEAEAPCFVEKPAALSSAQCARALERQVRHGSWMQVGYNRRFYGFLDDVRARLARRTLTAVEVHLAEPVGRLLATGELKDPRDVLAYKGSHVLDLVAHLVGPLEVRSVFKSGGEGVEPSSVNGLLWATRHGVPVHLSANWGAPMNTGIALYLGDELLRISPLERLLEYRGLRVVEASAARPFRSYEPVAISDRWVDDEFKPGFLRQARSFFERCVRGHDQAGIGATLQESLALARLFEQVAE